MSLLVASLYLLCIAFLFGSALYVFSRDPFSRLNSSYAVLALTLLGWVGSLFVFNAQTHNPALLLWGRLNFAAAALVAPAVYLFVCALRKQSVRSLYWLWAEAVAVALLALMTGLVDRSEGVLSTGEHITQYGPLFILYLVHIAVFLVAAVRTAFVPTLALPRQTRSQLRLIGSGIVVTAVIGIITNAVLPYGFGNFQFINVGTLSTIIFLAAVAYATVSYHLFNIQVILRATLVFSVLIAFALELYQAAVAFLTHLLPFRDATKRQVAATAVALIINAFTHDPLRSWLERLADQLLKRKNHQHRVL